MDTAGHDLDLGLHSYPCAPEDFVSPDVLAVLSRYRADFPVVPSWYGTDLISSRNYSMGIQVNARSTRYTLSIQARQAPHELPFEREAKP